MYKNCFWHSEQFLHTTCSPHVLQKEELLTKFTCTVSVTFEFGVEINSSSNVALGEMDLRAVALGTSAESFGKTFSFKFDMTFFSASSFECGGKI